MTWMQTASGKRLDLPQPRRDQIDPDDIAESLSKLPRFAGHATGVVYSVAQHSVLVADELYKEHGPEAALCGLVHDAAEFVTGDVLGPVKWALKTVAADQRDGLAKWFRDRETNEAFTDLQIDEICGAVDNWMVEVSSLEILERKVLSAILDALWIPANVYARWKPEIRLYDRRALITERDWFLATPPDDWHEDEFDVAPFELDRPSVWTWEEAKKAWSAALARHSSDARASAA